MGRTRKGECGHMLYIGYKDKKTGKILCNFCDPKSEVNK
jgi:hypothetical protein